MCLEFGAARTEDATIAIVWILRRMNPPVLRMEILITNGIDTKGYLG